MEKTVLIGLIIITLLVIGYSYLNTSVVNISDQIRRKSGAHFIRLRHGHVRYEDLGNPDGEPIVLIHGFSVPSFIFDKNVDYLTSKGFRVLRFDLYGRGLSDRPKIRYDLDLYTEQTQEIIKKLGFPKPFNILGVSMGSGIALDYSVISPADIKKIVLISPIGLPINASLSAKLIKIPILGDILYNFIAEKVLVKNISKNFHNKDYDPAFKEKFIKQFKYKGYKNSILSTLRNVPFSDLIYQYQKIEKAKKEVLVIWGKHDRLTPYSNLPKLKTLLPNAEYLIAPNAAHLPNYESPVLINDKLIKFLTKSI